MKFKHVVRIRPVVIVVAATVGGGVSSLTPPQPLTNKANNGRPIDGRLLSKETR